MDKKSDNKFLSLPLFVPPLSRTQKHCRAEKNKIWLHYNPSLFQHMGMTSSLKGKIQKLKDKQFGKVPLYYAHKNPPVSAIKTSIVPY